MKPLFHARLFCAACQCLFMGALVRSALAQDGLKLLSPSVQGASPPPGGQLPNGPYNLRWGDLKMLADVSMESEWNDNINLAESHRLEDYVLWPQVNLQAVYPVTQVNAINLSLGLGYQAYTEHPQFSTLLVTPGSALSCDVVAKEFKINVHDRFTYETDPSLYGNISGITRIGGLGNTAGIAATRELHDITMTLGFDHQDFFPSSSEFAALKSSSEMGTARVWFHARPGLDVGVESAGGTTGYGTGALSGYETYSIGAFSEWQVTSHLKFVGRAGYVEYLYEEPALTAGHSEISGGYVSLGASGNLNRRVTYALQGGHEVTVSIDGGLIQQWYVSLTEAWEVIRHGFLRAGLRYDNAVQPFKDAVDFVGVYSPSYERIAASLGFTYPVTRRLEASIDYELLLKNAAYHIADYRQNTVVLKLTLHL